MAKKKRKKVKFLKKKVVFKKILKKPSVKYVVHEPEQAPYINRYFDKHYTEERNNLFFK